MSNSAQRNGDDTTKRKGKKILGLLKVFLALSILIIILYNVKVRDHLTMPEDSPFSGVYVGKFIKTPESDDLTRWQFSEKDKFIFQASLKDQQIISAIIIKNDGSPPYHFSNDQISRIELRDGLFTVLETINPLFWLISILIYFVALTITTIRWWIILKATELPQNFPRAFKLTFMGFFFNNVVPGQTGGDIVRAYYIARENKTRKAESIISVFVDRGLGIIALAIIAAVIIPTDFELYGDGAQVIYGLIGIAIVGSLIFFSKRLRRLIGLPTLLKKLPFQEILQNLDQSIFLYRYKKISIISCFLMSFLVHIIIILSLWVLGRGIGIELPLLSYMAYIPIIFIISSLPLTPAGWGWGELAFVFFFGLGGVMAAKALALSLVFRISAALISLLGGIFLLLEKKHARLDQVENQEE